jgi:hypothetical protein
MAMAAGEKQGFRPGMVAVVQTFGEQLKVSQVVAGEPVTSRAA